MSKRWSDKVDKEVLNLAIKIHNDIDKQLVKKGIKFRPQPFDSMSRYYKDSFLILASRVLYERRKK